jgi:hypothetical protein
MTVAPGRPPRRTLLIALLVGLAILLIAVVIAVVFALNDAGRNGGPSTGPSVTDVPETVRPTVTPTPTGVPAPPGQDEGAPSPDQLDHVRVALETGDTSSLEADLADTVDVVLMDSGCCGPVSKQDAIDGLAYVGPGSGATWDLAPDDATLATLRGGDYADFFPSNAIVAVSSNGFLLSLVPGPDQLISRMLIGTAPSA